MDNILKLVKYVSKYGKVSKKFAANLLIEIFESTKLFDLPNNKQEQIFSNLISYFETIIICFDRVGVLNNKQNSLFTKDDIFKHIYSKTNCLINTI